MKRQLSVLSTLCGVITLIFATTPQAAQEADWGQHNPASTRIVDHSTWDQILTRYIQTSEDGVNRFAYNQVRKADKVELSAYITRLTQVDVPSLNRNEQFALWANLYNAITIDLILDNYPVASIREIKPSVFSFGPWKQKLVTMAGQELSLDDIEHNILRKHWQDPRVHYAVNCASIGCPNLAITPFTGDNLNDLLDTAARAFINHPRGARVEEGKLTVSSIYKWYKDDFGGDDAGVISHMLLYAEPALAKALQQISSIDRDEYDWTLNETSTLPQEDMTNDGT